MFKRLDHGLWWTVGMLIVLSLFFQIAQTYLDVASLAYHRDSFYPALWRQWLTPSLVHASWMHWFFNSLNLLALVFLFHTLWSVWRLCILFGLSSIGILLALYHNTPEVEQYAGMSGVLYALAVYGALLSLRRQKYTAFLVLVYVILKLFAHDWVNRVMGVSTALGDMTVITEVHWYGAIFGLLAAVVERGVAFGRRYIVLSSL